MKVLHVLYQSLPQVSGSSIRSRDILMSLQEIGVDVTAFTSPFQRSISHGGKDIINGVEYIRTSKFENKDDFGTKKSIFERIFRFFSIIPFGIKLYKYVKEEKPNIIHAHAMFYCAIPSIIVGKIFRIPVVYEFRSLWMYDKGNDDQKFFTSNLWLKLETYLLKKSDYIIFLNERLKSFFVNKSSFFENSEVINNAINTTYINHLKSKIQSKKNPDEMVFGYIGTITAYEGLDFMIESFQELNNKGFQFKLIIYGKGDQEEKVKELIEQNSANIEFRGPILPENVYEAYADIDAIVNPRIKSEVTDSVTPLKPLEGMAYEKLFIGSDVGGILEIVKPNVTGIIFKAGDKNDFKETLKLVVKMSNEDKNRLKFNALNYVEKNKSWIQNAKIYKGIYLSLIND